MLALDHPEAKADRGTKGEIRKIRDLGANVLNPEGLDPRVKIVSPISSIASLTGALEHG